jgi:hypothetical protein
MSDTLLSYDITTNPDPIQVSPDTGAASLATITIAVSHSPDPKPVTDPDQATGGVPRNSPPVKCTSIIFGIRSGNNAKDLTSDATLAHASGPDGWHIDSDGEGNFTATPITSPAPVTHDGLVFAIHDIPINKLPGRAWLEITETAALGDAPQDDRIATISLGKFPLELQLAI